MVELAKLSNRRVVHGEMLEFWELSIRRFVEWWNGGVVESSSGGMVELVELSNRQFVVIVKWRTGGVVDSSNLVAAV